MESHTSGKAVSAEIKFDLTSTLDAVQKSFESNHKAGIKQIPIDDSISYHYHLNIRPLIDSLKGKDEIAINNAFWKFFAKEGLVRQLTNEKILDTQACKSYTNVLEFYRLCFLFESLQLAWFKEDSIESSLELKEAPVTLAAIQNKIVEDNIAEYRSYLNKWGEIQFLSFPDGLKDKISLTKEKLNVLKHEIETFKLTENKIDADALLTEREKSLACARQKVDELFQEYKEISNKRIQLEHEEAQFFSSLKQKEIKHCLPLQHVSPIILESQILKGAVELKQAQIEYDKRSIKLTAIAKLVEQIDTLTHASIDTFLENSCKSLKNLLIQTRKNIIADSSFGEDSMTESDREFAQDIEKVKSGLCQIIQDKFSRAVKLLQEEAISNREARLSAYISQIQSRQDAASLNIQTSSIVDQWNEGIANLNQAWANKIAQILQPFQAEYKAIDPQSNDVTEKSADDLLKRARRALNDFLERHTEVNLLEESRRQEINNVVQQAWGIFLEDLARLKTELSIKDFVQSQRTLIDVEVKGYKDRLRPKPLGIKQLGIRNLAQLKSQFYHWQSDMQGLMLSQCLTRGLSTNLVAEIMQPAMEFSAELERVKPELFSVSLRGREKLPEYSGWWATIWFFCIPVIGYFIYEWWYNRKCRLAFEKSISDEAIIREAHGTPGVAKSQSGSRSSSRLINADLEKHSPHGAERLIDLKHTELKKNEVGPAKRLDFASLSIKLTELGRSQSRAERGVARETSLSPAVREHYLSPLNKLNLLTHSQSSPGAGVRPIGNNRPSAPSSQRRTLTHSTTSF